MDVSDVGATLVNDGASQSLIIGISVAIPALGVAMIIALIWFCMKRRRKASSEGLVRYEVPTSPSESQVQANWTSYPAMSNVTSASSPPPSAGPTPAQEYAWQALRQRGQATASYEPVDEDEGKP